VSIVCRVVAVKLVGNIEFGDNSQRFNENKTELKWNGLELRIL